MIKRLLVPLDGSAQACAVLPVAAQLTRALQGTLILFRVAEVPLSDVPLSMIDAEAEKAQTYLARIALRLELTGLQVETKTLGGAIARNILDAVQVEQADLLVMSRHERSGPVIALRHSIAWGVLFACHCDIMIDNRTEGGIMPLTLVDRFQPGLRRTQQAAIDAGQLRKLDEISLLEPQRLLPLSLLSLLLLVAGGLFFGVLNIAAYLWQTHSTSGQIGGWKLITWIVINIASYLLILLVHEALHAAAFSFWGGRPYFGVKLPYALYCGAKNQLFRRNQYLVVGLAPLVVITLAGIIFTLLSPALASYTIFASIGNVSGAAGDVWVVARLLRLTETTVVEDTETGYRAWEISSQNEEKLVGEL